MSQAIPTTPEDAAHISAQMDEYEAISTRLRAETGGMNQQLPKTPETSPCGLSSASPYLSNPAYHVRGRLWSGIQEILALITVAEG